MFCVMFPIQAPAAVMLLQKFLCWLPSWKENIRRLQGNLSWVIWCCHDKLFTKQNFRCSFWATQLFYLVYGIFGFWWRPALYMAIYQVLSVVYFWAGCHCYDQRTTLRTRRLMLSWIIWNYVSLLGMLSYVCHSSVFDDDIAKLN